MEPQAADGVPLPRAQKPEKRYLTHGQVAALAGEAGEARPVVLVLAYCGLRFGELAALRVRRVDLMRRRLEVAEAVTEVAGVAVWGTPKSHQQRSVRSTRSVAEGLLPLLAGKGPDDLVFTSPERRALAAQQLPTAARVRRSGRARRARGPDSARVAPHSASLAVAAGANVKAVQRMLGHASAAMTLDVYSGLFDDDLDGVAERLDEAVAQNLADFLRTNSQVAAISGRSASR